MKFKLEQKLNPAQPDAPQLWYAVPVTGELVSNETLTQEIAERSSLTSGDVDNALDNLGIVIPEHWRNGSPVKLRGVGTFRVSFHSEGVENPNDFSRKHIINAHIVYSPDPQLVKMLAELHIEDSGIRGGEKLSIDWLLDNTSGVANSHITPGGGITLSGSKMKIAGSDSSVGIALISQTSGDATFIAANAILVNKANELVFILPATLPAGNYKLSLTTQFNGSTVGLRAPRTVVYEHILTVE
jgi:predicted histone-like DNA-binding protein